MTTPRCTAEVLQESGPHPLRRFTIELPKGQHTITVVAANAAHMVLAQPAPVSVTFSVE